MLGNRFLPGIPLVIGPTGDRGMDTATTSGDLDYLLKARVADVRAYDRLYQRLIRKVELTDISASFVMEEIKDTTELPVDLA